MMVPRHPNPIFFAPHPAINALNNLFILVFFNVDNDITAFVRQCFTACFRFHAHRKFRCSIKKGRNYPYLRVDAKRLLSRLLIGQPQKKKRHLLSPFFKSSRH